MADINLIRTDIKKESNGVWVDFAEGIRLKIARSGNSAYNELLRTLSAPHLEQIREGSVDVEVYADILRKVRAATILLDWDNIEEGGKPVKYSKEQAYKFFSDPSLHDFYNFIIIESQNIDLFRQSIVKDALKN